MTPKTPKALAGVDNPCPKCGFTMHTNTVFVHTKLGGEIHGEYKHYSECASCGHKTETK